MGAMFKIAIVTTTPFSCVMAHCLLLAVLYCCQARGWAYLINTTVNLKKRGQVEEWGKTRGRRQENFVRGRLSEKNLFCCLVKFWITLCVGVNKMNWRWISDDAFYDGISQASLSRLQLVQNTAARLVTGAHQREHISPILASLHWLPTPQNQFQNPSICI